MPQRLEDNYNAVLARVDKARRRHGAGPVTLVAVSKFHPAAAVQAVAAAGQLDFGENYVQEALAKMNACPNLRWHMIGHVQSRKAQAVAGEFALIHTLDSQKLASALENALSRLQKIQSVLMEINIGAEPGKSGIAPAQAETLAAYALEHCPHLQLDGLMCIPPACDAGDGARPWFARLRELRDTLKARLGIPLPALSMGMSGDFEQAIAEGATIVRVGTAIFGARPPKSALAKSG